MVTTLTKKGYVTINNPENFKIYYEIHGKEGKETNKLLFIMGLFNTTLSWKPQTEYFGNHPDYQLCVFDNRGVGWSDAPFGLYSTSQMAQDVVKLLEHLDWTENIHVIGISMGGMIAQELALAKPHYIKSLCLTSTSPGRSLTPEFLATPAPEGSPHKTYEDIFTENFLDRISKTRKQPIKAACLRHYVSPSKLEQIKNNISHILVATGTWDNLVKPQNSFYLAKHLGVDVKCWEGSGHVLSNEQPKKYNEMLEKHFRNACEMRDNDEVVK
ncbi:5757_t:CDS:2 [Diversispora eburnea]|uniref:5757_t:CDS:1 n=1 Tax=Diversispora eburnea TaxID=1213867 RepID=A0A9N8V5K8_9GLOM|nr:5757_t:CDS:2 [Diversispora eburnea]